MTDEAIALLAPRIGTRAACTAAGVPQATWYRRHRISPPAPKPARSRIPSGSSRGRWPRPSGRRSWTYCTPGGSLTWPRTRFGRRCWTRAPTWGRCPPITGCCARPGRAGSGARRPPIPPPSSPSWWPPGRTRSGSWDITKLHGPAKWTYYHLYVILDIFSRYAVGWMVATCESAALAEKLIAATCAKQGIGRGQLSIHADRGSSMTSKPVALLLADLGVTQSHSRPHVSNDNPYSESQFKTLKYRPGFPALFASIEAARAHCQVFFPWYNNEHHHGGLGLHTAGDVHYGRAAAVRAGRAQVLDAAYLAHPGRFVRKPPAPPKLPGTSWINPPPDKETGTQ